MAATAVLKNHLISKVAIFNRRFHKHSPTAGSLRELFSSKVMEGSPNYFQPVSPLSQFPDKPQIRLRILSYNVLAQTYVRSTLFPYSPASVLKWKNRSLKLTKVILEYNADVICLQELDEFETYHQRVLKMAGYGCAYVKRPGRKKDGSAVLFKESRFEMVEMEGIEYNDLVPKAIDELTFSTKEPDIEHDLSNPAVRLKRDCVGVMVALKSKEIGSKVFIVISTHLYWDPELSDVKLAQAKYLLQRTAAFVALLRERMGESQIPILIGGDFNSQPGDTVHNYLTSSEESNGLQLLSLYSSCGREPSFTTHTPGFTGTLDHILFGPKDGVRVTSTLTLPGLKHATVIGGLPNDHHPSDHLPVGGELELAWKG